MKNEWRETVRVSLITYQSMLNEVKHLNTYHAVMLNEVKHLNTSAGCLQILHFVQDDRAG